MGTLLIAGCGDTDLPLDALSVRDALQAAPEVVQGLSPEARRRLAERLDPLRAPREASDPAAVVLTQGTVAEGVALTVRRADEARLAAGHDALRVARVVRAGTRWGLQALELSVGLGGPDPLGDPLRLEGVAGADTAEAEAAALAGRGGVLVRATLAATGASRAVRVVSWPVGVVVEGDTVFVNAGWLLAVSGDDPNPPPTIGPAPHGGPPPSSTASTRQHVSELRGNSYRPYGSMGQCMRDVRSRCATCLGGGTCEPRASLRDFSDSRAECAWLLEGSDAGVAADAGPGAPSTDRVGQLCLASMLSMPHVRACLDQAGACVGVSAPGNETSGLAGVVAALGDPGCRDAVDRCLAGGDRTLDEGSSERCGSSRCASPFTCREPCTTSGCSSESSGSGCGGCSSGSGCSSSSGSSGCSSSSGSGSCRSCRVADPGGRGPGPWAPWVELALSLAPLAWLLGQSRRRA